MEVDIPPVQHRTRSSTKRARSPSSPTQYDRPSKRVFSAGHDTSVPIPFPPFQQAAARLKGRSEDWVSQTQDLRLESPSIETSRFGTPVGSDGDTRRDEAMVDEPMRENDNSMCLSPARPPLILPDAPQAQHLHPLDSLYPPSAASVQYQNPNQLQIPVIQVQAATPSPVQMFPAAHAISPPPPTSAPFLVPPGQSPLPSQSLFAQSADETRETQVQPPEASVVMKRQRFTMGPRADCELCRQRVKGHYMHFD